ncbi:MAG TPA: biotin-dependent carboxyltransferase family protein [Gammaproteobacteria bacterium]
MIEVIRPGLLSTIQDFGRLGHAHLGVPEAGAVDRFDLRVANRLVGNPDGAAGLEMTEEGATLRFACDSRVALCGGAMEVLLDGAPVPMYQTLAVKAGSELACGRIFTGWRSYLAVAGGIDMPVLLGSRSSDTLAGLGPPALAAGMRLAVGTPVREEAAYLRSPPEYRRSVRLRTLPGPQQDWFTPDARLALRSSVYRVSKMGDRTGVRLEGQALTRGWEGELPSMGMVSGALQVPSSGQPIALLANHGTTGGYPVIAVVIGADLPRLAQLAPGMEVCFMDVSRADALAALREQEERLVQDIIPADEGLLAARALMRLAGTHASLKQAALSDGQRRIRIRK